MGDDAAERLMNGLGDVLKDITSGNVTTDTFVKTATTIKTILPTLGHFKILGEKGSGTRSRGPVQDFLKLRDQCLASGTLFEDPEFPPRDSSLYFSQQPPRNFEWKRPIEIHPEPKFVVEGASRFDVKQGELGDCWLLAAIANLTLHQDLFDLVVIPDQSFESKYAGIFHFRFWQYGNWVDVVVDDRLPTYNGELIFLHSAEPNEFWSALLEKAYAKLHGSYEALKGGSTCEAMEDFTGGVSEMYNLEEAPANLWTVMLKAYERQSLMACSIEPDPNVVEMQTPEGLVRGHAYSITKVIYMDIATPNTSGKIPLLRLRNPWGNEAEWNGPWSDKSAEWRFISESDKEKIGLTFEVDGEFWMSYRDFIKYFSRVEICNLSPETMEDVSPDKKWVTNMFEGEWVRGITAGGCRNFLETFWHNPQYNVILTDADEEDEENLCTIIVALMQKNRRSQRKIGAECLTIGFAIYLLDDSEKHPQPLDLNYFKYNASVAKSPVFINSREVTSRFKLPPGEYVVVPSTFDPNEEGEFILRVFTEKKNEMEERDTKISIGTIDPRVIEEEPPPEEGTKNEKIREFFRKLAGDDDEIDWVELKEILDYAMRNDVPRQEENIVTSLLSLFCGQFCREAPFASAFEVTQQGFSKDVCRSMIAMMDVDRSGKLGFDEFKQLWKDIKQWKAVFKIYDKSSAGYLSPFELKEAMKSAGYQLNNHILNALCHRYASKDGRIAFDDFMMCAVRLKTMMEIFKDKDTNNTDKATFTMEEWLENTLYS
ncbi:unnamed protein product [Nezara viridula]|uniref:Calpain-A n=1 Tax=Nezara viridula TaxID=85310 RepID=A0A9P0H833_NEZVI|nr:unnamed protein product [Nezara viridula]